MWDLRTLAQFQGSEMSPGLFQDFMGIQNPLVVEHSVVVKTVGFKSRSQIGSYTILRFS